MKKLLFAVSALAALSLLAPSVGFAQTAHNQVGIYTDEVGFTSNEDGVAPNDRPNAYLVLTNPVNTTFEDGVDTEVPITAVDGFECAVIFPAASGTIVLSEQFAIGAINVGTAPEYIVGFGTSQPVVDNALVLITWSFFSDGEAFELFLGSTATARFPGNMSIVDPADGIGDPGEIVYPANGDFALSAYAINSDTVVPVENQSWGDVKALFR